MIFRYGNVNNVSRTVLLLINQFVIQIFILKILFLSKKLMLRTLNMILFKFEAHLKFLQKMTLNTKFVN